MENTKALEVGRITFCPENKPATHENFAGAEWLTETIRTLRAQLAERDAQLAAAEAVSASLDEILYITNDEGFGDLEERLEEAFSREDVLRDANKALAKFKLLKLSTRQPNKESEAV